MVFKFLKNTQYPIALENDFPLIKNEDVIIKDDVFSIFKKYGVSVPKYYNEIEFEVNGEKGKYSRSRSGCYFCFYQQKIEWVWLHEQHPELFQKAMKYEKDGYTWNEAESLKDIIEPKRILKIKEDYLKKLKYKKNSHKSDKLVDILADDTGISCVNCFI